jgi:outer membrane protein TolC
LTQAQAAARVLDANLAASLATEGRQAQSLYDAGEISLLDLLDTRQRLLATETARLDADFGASRATVRLEAAIGRTCPR